MVARRRAFLLAALLVVALGCNARSPLPEVVAYTAIDADVAQPVYDDFKRVSGITVLPKFDDYLTKTVGLAAQIVEQSPPQCDVFWNNEILHTLLLDKRGLLEEFPVPSDEQLPAMYRSPRSTWHALATRARVLIVNTEVTKDDHLPRSIRDLADGRWRGRAAIANPLVGSMATHGACLFAMWGSANAEQFFFDVKENRVQIMASSKQVAQAVGAGHLAFGLTDSDDAIAEVDKAMPVAIVYPDQGTGQLGTLFIPNTVSIVKGAPHPRAAERLVNYILSPAVEAQLAVSESAQIPLHENVDVTSRLNMPASVRPMDVDFAAAADVWETTVQFLRKEFVAPK